MMMDKKETKMVPANQVKAIADKVLPEAEEIKIFSPNFKGSQVVKKLTTFFLFYIIKYWEIVYILKGGADEKRSRFKN